MFGDPVSVGGLYATGRVQERLARAAYAKKIYRFIQMKGLTGRFDAGIVAPPSRPAEGQAL